jgi:hypothetical protein
VNGVVGHLDDRAAIGPDAAWVLVGAAPDDPRVRLWTAKRMPFETDQTAAQRALVALVAPQIRAITVGPRDRLHGRFVSDDRTGRQPDAENVTFYNWRRGDGRGTAFAAAGGALSFERSYDPAPPCPWAPDRPLPFFTEWSARPRSSSAAAWERGQDLATFRATCPVVTGDDAGRHVWRALREQGATSSVQQGIFDEGYFGVDIRVVLPGGSTFMAAEAVKGCVDGVIASFQRFPEPLRAADEVIIRKHARWPRWRQPMTPDRFKVLVTAEPENRLFDGAPFNANGLAPCDDRCVCGSVASSVDARARVPTLAGALFAVHGSGEPS